MTRSTLVGVSDHGLVARGAIRIAQQKLAALFCLIPTPAHNRSGMHKFRGSGLWPPHKEHVKADADGFIAFEEFIDFFNFIKGSQFFDNLHCWLERFLGLKWRSVGELR